MGGFHPLCASKGCSNFDQPPGILTLCCLVLMSENRCYLDLGPEEKKSTKRDPFDMEKKSTFFHRV